MILSFSKSSLEETKQSRLSLTNLRVQTSLPSLQMNGGGGGGEEKNYFDGKKIYTYICYYFKQRKQRLAGKALTVLVLLNILLCYNARIRTTIASFF